MKIGPDLWTCLIPWVTTHPPSLSQLAEQGVFKPPRSRESAINSILVEPLDFQGRIIMNINYAKKFPGKDYYEYKLRKERFNKG